MHLEDLKPSFLVGNANLDLTVKPPSPAQCRIDGIGEIRCRNDDYLAPAGKTVHEGKQLCHDPAFHFSLNILTFRGDGIDFIDKYDGWCILFGSVELVAQGFFTVPVKLAHDLGA